MRCRRARRTRHGLLHRSYLPSEIDAFAAYCADLDRCYFLPIEEFPYQSQIQLRVGFTQNNQQLLINWAKDFEFAAKLGCSGAVAQLGERVHGMHEAAGSSPAPSTTLRSILSRPSYGWQANLRSMNAGEGCPP